MVLRAHASFLWYTARVTTPVPITPIGVFRGAASYKYDAPRQGVFAGGAGIIELAAGRNFETALRNLDGFERIWVIFLFDRNGGDWRPTTRPPVAVPGLEETDFGAFEYKSYEELKTDPAYCAWLDSGGEGPIPGGEDRQTVERRVLAALDGLLDSLPETGRAALVVHGGTIMTILAARGLPERSYYDWQVKTCRGFAVVPENVELRFLRAL